MTDDKLLERINNPEDIKNFNKKELLSLANEIRDLIVSTVATNGGHLSSNLGVVELAIAIHYVFDIKKDRIIWDVGHQSYAHKLLTGRYSMFSTLRQYGGISGFPKPSESQYDYFGTGHSSTSISAGLGISSACELKRDDFKVISVIGDGAMTAGLAFEGLNNAGHLKKNLIVILNDNEMSISKNVGALSLFLSRKVTGRFITERKKEIQKFFESLPGIGGGITQLLRKAEESIIALLTPGMLFEAFGFHYIGVIDGHNLSQLIDTLIGVRDMKGPVFIHVMTKKGKGYRPAESNPSLFHGVGPFDIETGRILKSQEDVPTYTEIFSQTLIRLAEQNQKIIAITAAMPEGTGLDKFAERYPDRYFDVGIAEQHAVTFAAGMAREGFIPVVAIYSTFLQRAYDQIIHDVCLQNLHVIFAMDRAGIVGEDGPTHHGLFDISFLRHIPNMTIMSPKDENELQHMMFAATIHNGPIAVRYPRGKGIGIKLDNDLSRIHIGKGEILTEGDNLAIFAIGNTVYSALEAAEKLKGEYGPIYVVNARFIKPLDRDLIINIAQRVNAIVTIEDHVLLGGFGSAILELLSDENIYISVKRIGVPDKFVEHGNQKILRKKYKIDSDGICESLREAFNSEVYIEAFG